MSKLKTGTSYKTMHYLIIICFTETIVLTSEKQHRACQANLTLLPTVHTCCCLSRCYNPTEHEKGISLAFPAAIFISPGQTTHAHCFRGYIIFENFSACRRSAVFSADNVVDNLSSVMQDSSGSFRMLGCGDIVL